MSLMWKMPQQERYKQYADRMERQFKEDQKAGRVPKGWTEDFNNKGDGWAAKILEAAFFDRFNIPFPERESYRAHDCIYHNFKVDAKNQSVTSAPKPDYDANFKDAQKRNDCDLYVFGRTVAPDWENNPKNITSIFLLGWGSFQRVKRGYMLHKGDPVIRNGRKLYDLQSDTWFTPINILFPMGIFTEFCKNYHREDLAWYEESCWKEDQMRAKTGNLFGGKA
jgi:hypothetical protein